MIDVETETLKSVEHSLRAEGFKPFEVELGGQGVGLLSKPGEDMVEEFMHSIGSVAKEESWLYWS